MIDYDHLRIGHGHDIHRLFPGKELWLGGVRIHTSDRGFDTHSDGDVLSHAVIDAIAGAMADGDLGTHYPEDDPETQTARSLDFVKEFAQYMRNEGYELINLDAFVTLGPVRLRPFIPEIQRNVAQALDLPIDRLSIKARSNDGIGVVGAGEACSATVTVLMKKVQ